MPEEFGFNPEDFEEFVEVENDDEDDEIDGGSDWVAMCGQCGFNDVETELSPLMQDTRSILVTPFLDTLPATGRSTPLADLFGRPAVINITPIPIADLMPVDKRTDVEKKGCDRGSWEALSDICNYDEPADEPPVYGSALGSALRTDEAAGVRSYTQEASRPGLMPKSVSTAQGAVMTAWPSRRRSPPTSSSASALTTTATTSTTKRIDNNNGQTNTEMLADSVFSAGISKETTEDEDGRQQPQAVDNHNNNERSCRRGRFRRQRTTTTNNNDDDKQYTIKQQSRVPNGSGIIGVWEELAAKDKKTRAEPIAVLRTGMEPRARSHLGTCTPVGGVAMACRGQQVPTRPCDLSPIKCSSGEVATGVDPE